jgi:hypothetical protein
LYNILIEFWIPMKLVKLIKMCLNETYGKVQVYILSDKFPIQKVYDKETLYRHYFSTLLYNMLLCRSRKFRWD